MTLSRQQALADGLTIVRTMAQRLNCTVNQAVDTMAESNGSRIGETTYCYDKHGLTVGAVCHDGLGEFFSWATIRNEVGRDGQTEMKF
jgi:hypothetical protein